jgi:hypothetical protein
MMMPDGEKADNRNVVGLLDYLNWRKEYDQSDRDGQLAMLFCAAFEVNDSALQSVEDDATADSLIRTNYCYDDFVADVQTTYESWEQ